MLLQNLLLLLLLLLYLSFCTLFSSCLLSSDSILSGCLPGAFDSHPPPLPAGWIWKRRYGDLANVSWLRQHAAELHAQQQFAAAGSIGSGGASANGDGAAQVWGRAVRDG